MEVNEEKHKANFRETRAAFKRENKFRKSKFCKELCRDADVYPWINVDRIVMWIKGHLTAEQ